MGNLAQQKEWVKIFHQWAERLHGPTAKRMGLTIDEFYTRMYQEAVTGDWAVFGDQAKELKWVGNVVEEIIEDNIVRRPDDLSPYNSYYMGWVKNPDAASERVRLPRLRAFDFYFIYNRDDRFFVAE